MNLINIYVFQLSRGDAPIALTPSPLPNPPLQGLNRYNFPSSNRIFLPAAHPLDGRGIPWFLNGGFANTMKTIVLTGGGTAGHVTPNLALIPRLQADGWIIHYIGAANSPEQKLINSVEGVTFHTVSVGKLRRYFDLKNFTDPFRVISGIFQAKGLIREIQPNVVFSKGGFVSVPVVYGAAMNHVPVVIHESDMTPGLANRLSAPFAKVECCTFPEAVKYAKGKGVHTSARRFSPATASGGWSASALTSPAPC